MVDFQLTPAALRDLEGIWGYTVEQWGVAQAEHYIDNLHHAFESLVQAPLAAPTCNHIRPGYRRLWVERHAVYYRVDGDTVVVVRVLHERMDATRHL